ncbi:DUF2330 domain-containing protein [Hyphococcus sp.]|uniref:DUF2330 domain-containing protein n=1 Tax=Hyphococcus sp. TaxID=2038636 RepID=UPI002088C965|nr:MAG: hypothetical protein DHS20C04_28450 [Marinicaulis sp.]
MKRSLKKTLLAAAVATSALAVTGGAVAFCGFYVAKADTKLFNKASKVAIMRDGERTVMTMANDYQGDLKEFAIVIPVPVVLQEGQIHVTDNAILDHLDAYTAPRLVEYFDEDPCMVYRRREFEMAAPAAVAEDAVGNARKDGFGVTVEAEYTVGEYDIQILSAKESDGLAGWLVQNGYKLPQGAEATLGSYIKQGTKFFVAKVNLEEQAKTGLKYLRPLQVAFESPKFLLPIRLGTVNAQGKQELFVFALTRSGRIETTNYRTTKLPTGMDIPLYVKGEFGDFYKSMFEQQVEQENERAVFLEYAWDMNWCDPCAADPLSQNELRELGVYWLDGGDAPGVLPRRPNPQAAQDVFVTRLHVSYDAEHFPEDLQFKETGDRSNYQGRYVLRHPYKGDATCDAAKQYRAELPKRFEKEAQTLANLTGWDIDDIRDKMGDEGQSFDPPEPDNWWKRLWGGDKKDG